MEKMYDITIIGGGPVGMFAGFYAGLRDAQTQIIESLPELGGQVKALYPEKTILDVAGFVGVTGDELITRLQKQLDTMDVDQKVDTKVTDVVKKDDYFEIETNHGVTKSKAMIIATGNGAFKPRELRADNAKELTGKRLFYSINDLNQFKDQDVMVAGGGDSAVDMALMLEKVANKVYLLHRRNEFRGLEYMVDRLKESSVKVVTPYLIKRLDEVDNRLKVTSKKVKTEDDEMSMMVDDLVVNYGFISNNRQLKEWQIQPALDHRLIEVNQTFETSVPGVFAIGDQITYPGKQDLIATGFGEAPTAINVLMKEIYPDRRGPVHSTSLHRK
ncbi:NAD(P)/FAD-dependent oxidoreductase [Fructilactobacillus fructivorans]|nr:NAD(P)/FAD-dependent oxidoreductase [Fructilactobacillus fructivorans]KRK57467.1 thioredoxin reductase [Fructilactobacillus fructivorans]KRN41123.1 thioredoxin reductase [Fructilactobacillus fructivorans]KRN42226.1 thioredoxin reductase [Fructilactobacillus fructivorans]